MVVLVVYGQYRNRHYNQQIILNEGSNTVVINYKDAIGGGIITNT